MFSTLYKYLGEKLFHDDRIICSLYKYLGIPRYHFLLRLNRYTSGLKCMRDKKGISLTDKQLVHDTWIDNSQITVDCGNGCDTASMVKEKYEKQFGGIDIELMEGTNKHGREIMKAIRHIATTTVRDIVNKLKEKGYGTVFNYRPFFVGVATEREKLECLCKICLNTRILFNTVMNVVKGEKYKVYDSITESGESCQFSQSGYIAFKCINGDCDICNGILNPPHYPLTNLKQVKYHQFETVKATHKIKSGKEKKNSRTERVEYQNTIVECNNMLDSLGKKYRSHRYDVEHDSAIYLTVY